MSGVDVVRKKCTGPINSPINDGVTMVNEENSTNYSGFFSGIIDRSGKLIEIRGCDANVDGKCVTDGVMCPVPRVIVNS